jgi:hypothetical protein
MTKQQLSFLLLIGIVFIKTIANFSFIIERFYSTSFYSFTAQIFRFSLGWIPFSVGDLLYISIVIFIGYKIYKTITSSEKKFKDVIFSVFIFGSSVYLLFYVLWGLNYSRIPVKEKLQLTKEYTQADLLILTKHLIQKSNQFQFQITSDKNKAVQNPYTHQQVFDACYLGYEKLAKKHPFLAFTHTSIKNSLLSLPLTYMGFSGYLNPFTNEAQVNNMIPMYNFPTTSCHEMAHQIGISPESEANLVGHLASTNNPNLYFKYSGYTYALRYCLHEIYNQDVLLYEALEKEINPGVLKNFEETTVFQTRYESPIEFISKKIYGNYLEMNHQKGGMKTYNAFVGLMINYYKTNAL